MPITARVHSTPQKGIQQGIQQGVTVTVSESRLRVCAAVAAQAGLAEPTTPTAVGGDTEGTPLDAEEVEEDERMEGTVVYLAPELAQGGASSIAGDCWALG